MSYEMVGKNGDAEVGASADYVRVNVNSGAKSGNFITNNICELHSDRDPMSTEEMPLLEQLNKSPYSPEQNMKPAQTYGCLNSKWVDENCYIRPKFLKFAPHEGVLQHLQNLLCEKWKMDQAKFLINVFTATDEDEREDQSPETREKLRKIVRLGRKTNSWFMAHSQTDPRIAHYSREESQKSATSHRNMVYWKTWSDIKEEDRKKLTGPDPATLGSRINTPEVRVVENDHDQKMLARMSSCFLFPEYSSSNEVRDHLVLVKELAKTFDDDEHRDSCKFRVNVCSPINFFVPTSDSPEEELSDEEKDMVTELLKSGIPTIVLYSSAISISDFKLKLGDRLDGVSDNDIWIRVWINNEDNNDVEQPEHTFIDLPTGLKDVLVKSTEHSGQNEFKEHCTQLYLSMVLGLEETCKSIITDEELGDGQKDDLVSMIHLYDRPDLLDLCIKSNYDIKSCLYNCGAGIVGMMLQKADKTITKEIKTAVVKYQGEDFKKRTAEFYNCIYKLIGKDGRSIINPIDLDNPNQAQGKLELDDVMYIFYCFNEDWEMAEIMRKHSDFSIFKCFVAIKAMQQIKKIQSNTGSSDYVEMLDDQIEKMDKQAGKMIENSYKQSLDIGPVVFWEHHQYNDKTIIDMAGETGCHSILEDKTHIHSYITTRFNGALDPTTCWINIVLSWVTCGLLAPLLIKFVPKQSKRDETTLFLNEKGTKRTFLEKITSFWASPRSKCYLLMVTYLVFLYLQTLVILDTTRITPTIYGDIYGDQGWYFGKEKRSDEEERLRCYIRACLVFVLCFLTVEIDISQVKSYNIKSKLCHYFSNGYNQVDLFSASTFLLYVILTFLLQGNENAYLVAKAVLSASYIGYIIRFTQFLQLFEDIGPKLISIKNMIADLVFFASFLLLTIFAYGIVSEFLLHPYPRSVPAGQIADILKRPYVNMFGELDLDTLEQGIETGVCKYEHYLDSVKLNNDGTSVDEAANCEDYICGDTCRTFKLLGRIMLGMYTMMTVILLTNLLVSIFGKTYDGDFDKTRQLWQLQRYKLVKESESQCFLPFPPFNFLHSVYTWIRSCPCCCNGKNTEFYEQYIKEVEYRCGRQLEEDDKQEKDDK
ncbi:uncharacterized protein LOC134817234 [Bolinopsis microptera]|uniref:uncharacterized protein LOC134817234 n=1 Tax=Bolinopsis microptera TaxID=2820187 RepID=UPI00307A06F7